MHNPSPALRLASALALLTCLCACSGDELALVHIDLAKDGSGTLTTHALVPTPPAVAAETGTAGVDWQLRASLVASQGRFADIADLKLGGDDVRFTPAPDGDRLRVQIARGPEVRWLAALTPDQAARQQAARAFDPNGSTREIGDVIRFELRAPGTIVTSGVLPASRGVAADRDGRRAILLLPARAVREAGDAFVWDVSWLVR